jgi:hypothetical protein
MELDERLSYLGSIPHAQRSILLVSAAMLMVHPRGADLVRDIRRHHAELDGQQLCVQVLLDLMISLAGKWDAGSSVLFPVASLLDQVVTRATNQPGAICLLSLAEQLWEVIERMHDHPGQCLAEAMADPSCN